MTGRSERHLAGRARRSWASRTCSTRPCARLCAPRPASRARARPGMRSLTSGSPWLQLCAADRLTTAPPLVPLCAGHVLYTWGMRPQPGAFSGGQQRSRGAVESRLLHKAPIQAPEWVPPSGGSHARCAAFQPRPPADRAPCALRSARPHARFATRRPPHALFVLPLRLSCARARRTPDFYIGVEHSCVFMCSGDLFMHTDDFSILTAINLRPFGHTP